MQGSKMHLSWVETFLGLEICLLDFKLLSRKGSSTNVKYHSSIDYLVLIDTSY